MNCKQSNEIIRELILAGSESGPTPELTAHLAKCLSCTRQWNQMRRTMSLLDEWQAPDPSPFFGTRLQARLAEIRRQEAAPGRIFQWRFTRMRTAVFAAALCIALAAGIFVEQQQQSTTDHPIATINAPKGTAVNDLQMLDKNQDIYSSYDLLDDIGTTAHDPEGNKAL